MSTVEEKSTNTTHSQKKPASPVEAAPVVEAKPAEASKKPEEVKENSPSKPAEV
jgi:hypothetical protein